MKFRTELEIAQLHEQINYSSKIFAIGSCFAQHIAERLAVRKFDTTLSPLGILFNPASIASTLERLHSGAEIDESDFICQGGIWTTYHAHSQLAATSLEEAKTSARTLTEIGKNALHKSDYVLITLGTAWVYRLNESGMVVANCHKRPRDIFSKELLTASEIVDMFIPLFEKIFHNKQVIFSVSPVRHIGDGLEDNSLSKATLRIAVAELCRRYDNAHYFAAYEIMMDDLRDYRFYADDMLHPSQQAIEYIWQKFLCYAIDQPSQQLCHEVERIIKAASHRPLNSANDDFKKFCRRQLNAIEEIKSLDFSQEVEHFRKYIDKN